LGHLGGLGTSPGFVVMARRTQGLQVRFVPEQRRVTQVFDDVVHLEALLHTVTLGAGIGRLEEYLMAQGEPASRAVPAPDTGVDPSDGVRRAASTRDERAASWL